jgi:anaerobic ribonucleoside-triphosphate reductase activating protein
MDKIIRICGVEKESIVDGPGFRYVLFVQGCPHRCKGCHNPESWDFDSGYEMTTKEVFRDIRKNPYLQGVTFSGGEPFEQADALLELGLMIKEAGMGLMSYSGYTIEQLEAKHDEATDKLLDILDILVDGPYIEAERNLTLIYRGSENQRVIDLKKTREAGEIVLYQSDFDIEIVI